MKHGHHTEAPPQTLGQRLFGTLIISVFGASVIAALMHVLAGQSWSAGWSVGWHIVLIVGITSMVLSALAKTGAATRIAWSVPAVWAACALALVYTLWPVSVAVALIAGALAGLLAIGASQAPSRLGSGGAPAHTAEAAPRVRPLAADARQGAKTPTAPPTAERGDDERGHEQPTANETRPFTASVHQAQGARSVADVLAELDGYAGLDAPAQQLRELIAVIEHERRRGRNTEVIVPHLVFVGAPGTGKTTIARLYGEALYAMGVLDSGHVVECDHGDLVDIIVGGTAVKTRAACERAHGGVLFIDEAYELAGKGSQDFGPKAVTTLMKHMEDHRGQFVVIVAGYEREMDTFLSANPGLRSRFGETVRFPVYDADACAAIFAHFAAADGYTVEAAASALLVERVASLRRDPRWANGRSMRTLFDYAKRGLAVRLAGREASDDDNTLTTADIERALVKFAAEHTTPEVPGPSVSEQARAAMLDAMRSAR